MTIRRARIAQLRFRKCLQEKVLSIMPRGFIRKSFDRWYKRNRKRFRFHPWVIQSRRDYFVLQFQGMVPEVSVLVGGRSKVEVWVTYQRKYRDILIDFDLWEARSPEGYYFCRLCTEPEFFTSREGLWEKHSFEPLLEWMNEKFDESHWLLWFDYGGSTEAQIRKFEERQMPNSEEHLFHACPIVCTQRHACVTQTMQGSG